VEDLGVFALSQVVLDFEVLLARVLDTVGCLQHLELAFHHYKLVEALCLHFDHLLEARESLQVLREDLGVGLEESDPVDLQKLSEP